MSRVCVLVVLTVLTAFLIGCSSVPAQEPTAGSISSTAAGGTADSAKEDGPSNQAASEAPGSSVSTTAGDESRKSGPSNSADDKGDFVLPDSDKLVCATYEIDQLTNDELYRARNELFARHGAKFGNSELSSYFEGKEWYQAIEPKLDEYGVNLLNLAEATNASTIKRIELERGSSHVIDLDPKRVDMYKAYREKAEEYRGLYGNCAEAERDGFTGLTGLCLVQLVDFDNDEWEELLLVYHDKSQAPEGDFFDPSTYRGSVWTFKDGALSEYGQATIETTQGRSAYLLICKTDDGYEFVDGGGEDEDALHYYSLSHTTNASAGERYWYNNAGITFDFRQLKTITEETLKNLGSNASRNAKVSENTTAFLVGEVALQEAGGNDSTQLPQTAILQLDSPIVYSSSSYGEGRVSEVLLGSLSSDAEQPQWDSLVGERIAVVGKLKGTDQNMWPLSPCSLEGVSVMSTGEGVRTEHRDNVATAFATAIRTNYRMENGEYTPGRLDYKQYVSPTSELYEWSGGNGEGADILVLGNACRVESAEVVDAIGDTYIVKMVTFAPRGSLENEVEDTRLLAVVFGNDDLVEHAYFWWAENVQ